MSFTITAGYRNRQVTIQISQLKKRNAEGIRQAFYYIGKDLQVTARKLILKKPKSGRLYKIRRLSMTTLHQASAPGEAPANLTGKLKRSVGFNVRGSDSMQFGYKEGSGLETVKYGRALELGYASRNLKPRPALKMSIQENERNILRHFNEKLQKELSKKK